MGSQGCNLLLVTALLVSVRELWAQAPGDEADRCTTNHANPPQYPDTIRMLMDSYSYENLLPGNGTGSTPIADAVWNDFSFDGNDVNRTLRPTYWQQGAGGVCRFQTQVCGWGRQNAVVPQNNWLFTQHIRPDFDSSIYSYNVTIHVEATYQVQSCRERHGCRQGFNLLHYMTNSQQLPNTEGNGYMNPANYEKFAEPYAPVSSTNYNNTFDFTLPPSSTGFYVALQDNGSCIALSRLRVYRNNCKSRQIGMVKYSDAPPPSPSYLDSPLVPVSCAPHSSIRSATGSRTVCFSNGTWGPEVPQCECDPGYEETTQPSVVTCTACEAGYFRSVGMDACTICPTNSNSTTEAVSTCDCDFYFFRNDTEDETAACTTSPSKPQNVIIEATNSSLVVAWDLPDSDGGRTDLYFNLSICLVGSSVNDSQIPESSHAGHNNVVDCHESEIPYIKVLGMSYTFTGLKPVTMYRVVVQLENGVSHKDDRVHLRRVEMDKLTNEGEPEEVSNPTTINNVVLVWGPPRVPNGKITCYQVRLTFTPFDVDGVGEGPMAGSGAGNETDSLEPTVNQCGDVPDYYEAVGPHTLYFVLEDSLLPNCSHNLTFSIRAKTGKDTYGVWSPGQTIVPKFVCPSPPPCEECPSLDCDVVSSPSPTTTTSSVLVPTSTPTSETNTTSGATSPTNEEPSVGTGDPSAERSQSDLERCAYYMLGSAVAFAIIVGLLSCLFSCTIACLCHKHKMKTYKVRVKKHLQSKWDY